MTLNVEQAKSLYDGLSAGLAQAGIGMTAEFITRGSVTVKTALQVRDLGAAVLTLLDIVEAQAEGGDVSALDTLPNAAALRDAAQAYVTKANEKLGADQ